MIQGAANKYPDQVDKNIEAARAINVDASKTLAQLCAARKTFLIYISTDYVFSGKPGEAPYSASAKTGPTTTYGQLKLDGETATLQEFASVPESKGLGVALRVPVLYGSAEQPSESAINVLMDTVWESQKRVDAQTSDESKIKVDHWAQRYPTSTEDVGRVCHGELFWHCSASLSGFHRDTVD